MSDDTSNSSSNKTLMYVVTVISLLLITLGGWYVLNRDKDDSDSMINNESNQEKNEDTNNDLEENSLASNYVNSIGDYEGTWNDPTYDMHDMRMTGSLLEEDDGSLNLTLGLYGLTFGLADPQSVTANLKDDGSVTLVQSTPLVNGLSGTFNPESGEFDIKASSPVLGTDSITFSGKISKDGKFTGTAVVSPAGGGDLEMTLTK